MEYVITMKKYLNGDIDNTETCPLTCIWPQMVGLRGMPKASFFFFLFFSPFSFPESSPGVSEVLSFLLGLPSGDVKLLRFVEGFSAKNF